MIKTRRGHADVDVLVALLCDFLKPNHHATMRVKPTPAYVSEHINEDNVKSIFNNDNILHVSDDLTFAELLGYPLTKIKSLFPRDSSAFESLSRTQLQIEAGDDDSYVRVCKAFTKASLEVHKVLREEFDGSCYTVSTYHY